MMRPTTPSNRYVKLITQSSTSTVAMASVPLIYLTSIALLPTGTGVGTTAFYALLYWVYELRTRASCAIGVWWVLGHVFHYVFGGWSAFVVHLLGWALFAIGHRFLERRTKFDPWDALPVVLWAPYWVVQDYLELLHLQEPPSVMVDKRPEVVVSESKKQRTVVFLHDFLGRPADGAALFGRLPAENHVQAPVLDCDLVALEDQVAHVTKQLAETYADVVLVGHGYGAVVAQHLSRVAPWKDSITQLVLVGAPNDRKMHPCIGFWQLVAKLGTNLTGAPHWQLGELYPRYNMKRTSKPEITVHLVGDRDLKHPAVAHAPNVQVLPGKNHRTALNDEALVKLLTQP